MEEGKFAYGDREALFSSSLMLQVLPRVFSRRLALVYYRVWRKEEHRDICG